VSIRLQPGSLLRIHGSIYPKPTLYTFKPLKEDVLVYDAPFRLVVDVVAADFDALRAELRGRSQITIKGTLDYQACDDGVCYLPASVLFQWTLKVAGR
jgi:cytochrome c biogenesis DsbD-like protein